jgi:hypothetical protein
VIEGKQSLLDKEGKLRAEALPILRQNVIVRALSQCPGMEMGIAGRRACCMCVYKYTYTCGSMHAHLCGRGEPHHAKTVQQKKRIHMAYMYK